MSTLLFLLQNWRGGVGGCRAHCAPGRRLPRLIARLLTPAATPFGSNSLLVQVCETMSICVLHGRHLGVFFCAVVHTVSSSVRKTRGPLISRGPSGVYGRAHQSEKATSPHRKVPQTSGRTTLLEFLSWRPGGRGRLSGPAPRHIPASLSLLPWEPPLPSGPCSELQRGAGRRMEGAPPPPAAAFPSSPGW